MISNTEISKIFRQLAELLAIKGENRFRIRSYENAALKISGLNQDIVKMSDQEILDLDGIGKGILEKIRELERRGSIADLEKLKEQIPSGLVDLLEVENLGPKRVKVLHDELSINNVKELKKALQDNRVQELEGFGEKLEEKLLKAIENRPQTKRMIISEAEDIVAPLITYLKKDQTVQDCEIAGSFRRRRETVGDLDILITSAKPKQIINRFVEYTRINNIMSQGDTKASVRLTNGLQIDLRVVDPKSFGAALMYFTGSRAHNIHLRSIALDKGFKLNEYGLYKQVNEKKAKSRTTEKQIYHSLGLQYIEPELREDKGEIKAAKNGSLPKLILRHDIKGDLQTHTTESDGISTLEEMVAKAKDLNYKYMAVTDHSEKMRVAHGLDVKRIKKQIKKIDKINQNNSNFKILKGSEVDINKDGSLDLPDEILSQLDVVVISTHFALRLSKQEQTERVIQAIKNPYVNIWAHPTQRLINKREPIEIDMEKVFKAAKQYNCVVEINAHPHRLDLNPKYARMAKKMGLKMAIDTDAHSISGLDNIKYGVWQARRSWLTKDDVINCLDYKSLKKFLSNQRSEN